VDKLKNISSGDTIMYTCINCNNSFYRKKNKNHRPKYCVNPAIPLYILRIM